MFFYGKEVCEHTLVITPPNSLIELLELSPDYDFQAVVTENGFLPSISTGNSTDVYLPQGVVITLDADEWQRSDTFFSLLWDTMHCQPFRPEVAQHLALAFLYDIKSIQRQRQMSSPTSLSRQDEVLQHFINLVNEHSKCERTLSFYADKLCLTPRYLGTLIREASGQTVMQWINQAVILEAKVMLRHSTLPICRIAEELRFSNPSFFSKFFKRMTGMTPADYRNF